MFTKFCRYLATGENFSDLATRFLLGSSTVKKIVRQTIKAINKELLNVCIPQPQRKDWKDIQTQFEKRWNFPYCLGAADGKHVYCCAPRNSSSLYYNYKKSMSQILSVVVDANYKFVSIDVGAYGSNHDSTVFWNSEFGKLWLKQDKKLNLPVKKLLPGTTEVLPYVQIGDAAFGLKDIMLTPFPGLSLSVKQRIFNYRQDINCL